MLLYLNVPSTYLEACAYELKLPIAALANPNDVSKGLVPTVSLAKLRVPKLSAAPWTLFSRFRLWLL